MRLDKPTMLDMSMTRRVQAAPTTLDAQHSAATTWVLDSLLDMGARHPSWKWVLAFPPLCGVSSIPTLDADARPPAPRLARLNAPPRSGCPMRLLKWSLDSPSPRRGVRDRLSSTWSRDHPSPTVCLRLPSRKWVLGPPLKRVLDSPPRARLPFVAEGAPFPPEVGCSMPLLGVDAQPPLDMGTRRPLLDVGARLPPLEVLARRPTSSM
ncbi:uncharacterized protein SCHCODRAFT_02498988 [Schizophyllum commune H4-8]|nr:uncharacterized protein SCHCODRAFT_02498988 [Schizophyllum commune H4-8]KAI5893007.1 hypothetical protein SCHCODRAFT_02498988 [Schizophyllum commune H4-8]